MEVKKPSDVLLKELTELETALDVFNIIVLRQGAEVQVIEKKSIPRSNCNTLSLQVQKTRKIEEENKKKAGWFGGWWGGGASDPNSAGSDIGISFTIFLIQQADTILSQPTKLMLP